MACEDIVRPLLTILSKHTDLPQEVSEQFKTNSLTLRHFAFVNNTAYPAGEHEQAAQRMTVESVHAALDEVWPHLMIAEHIIQLESCSST